MSNPKEDLATVQKELLIRYLDGSLERGEEAEVEHLIERSAEASCELQEFEALTALIRSNKAVFCPDPMDLSDFTETGDDPSGFISEHLGTCGTCRHEVDMLRASGTHKIMPLGLFERVTAELPRHLSQPLVTRPGNRLLQISERLSSLFESHWVTAGAVALVLVLVMVMYPRDTPPPTIGKSTVSWNHLGNGLSGAILGGAAVRKPYLAIILFFEGFKKPLSQKAIDGLYQALKPSQQDRDRYEVVPPAELTGIITEKRLPATDVPKILEALKARLDRGEVVLVTVRALGERFSVHSKLIDVETGGVLDEKTTDAASYSELKSKVRQTAYSVLHVKP